MWTQVYDPLNNWVLSTIVASLPIVILLGGLAFHLKAHIAALLGLASALVVTVFVFGMPFKMAAATSVYGAAFGLMPIGWIILNVIFMYKLTVEAGLFEVLQDSLTGITNDARLQVVLISFCFGAFFEGAAGFGTPVAVTAAILIGLGFKPLQASVLSLIANTAPVAFGARSEHNGIRSMLDSSPYKIDLQVEYLDAKRYNTESVIQALLEVFQKKFINEHFDVVIVSDDDAFNFALRFRPTLFPGVPIVFCGVND